MTKPKTQTPLPGHRTVKMLRTYHRPPVYLPRGEIHTIPADLAEQLIRAEVAVSVE